ncbi:MAG: hypothetical protein IPP49_20140 [Saprospiraceae bacterium]|nr:hypothetical protein [Saprospiraceae bacterium]
MQWIFGPKDWLKVSGTKGWAILPGYMMIWRTLPSRRSEIMEEWNHIKGKNSGT